MPQLTVADVMTAPVVTVEPTTPFKEVAMLLSVKRISAVPVVDSQGKPIGVVSEADLLPKEVGRGREHGSGPLTGWRNWRRRQRASATTAAQVMTAGVKTTWSSTPLSEAARQLDKQYLRRLFVTDDHHQLVGVLARHDVLRVVTRSDVDLVNDIQRDVIKNALWLDPRDFPVDVYNGEVTLNGTMDRRSTTEIAERLTAAVPGVVVVHNKLQFDDDDVT